MSAKATHPPRKSDGSLGDLDSISRPDLVLLVIPLAFIAAIALGTALGFSLSTQLLGASLVGVVALVDALFVNPP